MPTPHISHDSLPYIDPPPPPTGPHSLSAATTLLNSLLPPTHKTTPHPSLPPLLPPPPSTPLAQTEQTRIANKVPLTAIDTTRYELPSTPTTGTATLSTQLKQAYTSSHYLRLRSQHLALLSSYGTNAWLIGNSQLEDILREIEKEVVDARAEVEDVNRGRKKMQEGSRGEMEGLERGWREGVGRVVEVEVAVEGLEGRRREGLRERAAR
ncbi:MAG: hypothetical protein Q9182_005200 [Xanthomendoza sp. 2 TL-2023]